VRPSRPVGASMTSTSSNPSSSIRRATSENW
jgi:hypothetical protein